MDIKIISILQKAALIVTMLFVSGIEVTAENLQRNGPIKVIIDTDLDSDVDDVGALAMLYNLHHAGLIELLGVIVTSDDPYAPVCAAALNTYYELPQIPVGYLKGQPELMHHSRYTKQLAKEFPSGMKTWEEAADAVELYRRILAQNPDESIIVVTVGHLSSLQGLLQSKPDGFSDLNGHELAHKKIKEWICMGGHYPEGKEANFYRPDPASTVYCVNNWENDVVFCGWEAGNEVITGGKWLKEKLAPGHPVYRGYELYNNFAGRQSWDQIAVLQLFPRGRKLFTSVKGICVVASDGSNTWETDNQGKHRYIVLEPGTDTEVVKQLVDNLMAGEMTFLKE